MPKCYFIIWDSGSCRAKYSLTISMPHIWIINAAQTPYCPVLHHSFSAYLSYYFPSLSFTELRNNFLSQHQKDFKVLFQGSNTSTLLKRQSFLACLLPIYTSTSVTCRWRAWIEKHPLCLSLSACAVNHTPRVFGELQIPGSSDNRNSFKSSHYILVLD